MEKEETFPSICPSKLATLLRFVRGALEAVGVEDPRRAGLQE